MSSKMSLFRRPAGALLSLILACSAAVSAAQADEPLFGFIYTTDLLPAGKFEIEQWGTWRHQKAHGSFNQWEGKNEFSYGVTDDFQLSAYITYDKTDAYHNGTDYTTQSPEAFSAEFPDPNSRFNGSKFIGVSLEAFWR